nr:sodium-dependent multivitamin transporter-like [Procambarus clarkii]
MLPPIYDWSEQETGLFVWQDYLVFIGMLVASMAIGIYYAVQGRHKANDEFLLGGRSLSFFPVSMSLFASYISGIHVLGGPSEAYYHGVQWWVICAGQVALIPAAFIFMPFFYELKLTSAYEYLELRYASRWVRSVAGGMFVLQMLLYQSVSIYAPALALASVTNFSLWVSVFTVGIIASAYTSFGGLKAVVWTDVLQLYFIIFGLMAIIIKGTIDLGGIGKVWELGVTNNRTGAQILTYGFEPLERHTVANLVVGALVGQLSQYSCTQTAIQRYVSIKSLSQAYMAIFLVIPFFILTISLTMLVGLVIFATYEGCDPLAAGLITKNDQILPFFVMDRLTTTPGLPGLFVACIFSATLSTISSGVNSQAAVTWEDVFAKIPRFAKLNQATQALLTKLLALGYGIISVGFALLAGNLGGVLQAGIAVNTAVAGPLLAVFLMALFLPFTNSKGACTALLVGTGVALGFSFGGTAIGIEPEMLPTSTDDCPVDLSLPLPSNTSVVRVSELQYPERVLGLSYTQLGPLGLLVGLVSGVLVSLATGMSEGRRVDRKLVHPWVRWTLPHPEDVAARTEAQAYENKVTTQC